MEQMMGQFPAGLFQEFFVKSLYIRVFVGEPEHISPVIIIDDLRSVTGMLFVEMDRLTTAAYTAAWAGHDFHKVILGFSAAQCFDELPGMSQTVDNSCPDFCSGNVIFGLHPGFI